jgi:hypothetical protein
MWKKILQLLPVLLITGCAATFTRLTAVEQPRNAKNQYLVETAFNTSQKSLRWNSIKVSVVADGKAYPMTPVLMLTNRWEGYIPVAPDKNSVNYQFRFDYRYNHFGTAPLPATTNSPVYTLKIVD